MNNQILIRYTGENIPEMIKDPLMREGFITNWKHMYANYGEGVDAQLLSEQIMLCDETMPILYAKPDPVRYKKGTRPLLEHTANEITKGAITETECVIRVMRFTRDLYKRRNGWHPFFGGTEEVLMEKGEELCECVARLEVALLEVLGIPARIITHTIGGHVTAEAYADGKWGYIDPRCGMYFLEDDGRLASLWDMWHDHSILDRQSESVRADVSPRFRYDERIRALKEHYLSPLEVNTYKFYSLMDADKYNYSWMSDEECIALGMNEICTAYGEIRKRVMHPDREEDNAEKYPVRFTLPDGAVLSDDVMLGVRVNGIMCHPKTARFYIDGNLTYESGALIPVSELSTYQHGIILYGGIGGSLPVSTLSEGEHTLTVELEISPTLTKEAKLRFIVK